MLEVFAPLRKVLLLGEFVLGVWLAPKVGNYFGRVAARVARLLAAIEAGTLKPLPARKARGERVAKQAGEPGGAVEKQPWEVAIPRRKLWLARAYAGKFPMGMGLGVVTAYIEQL